MDFRLKFEYRSLTPHRRPEMEPQAGRDLDRRIERDVWGVERAESLPCYSTDDTAAVGLARRFSREKGWWYFERKEVFGGTTVGWISESQPLLVSLRPIQASGPTRALAICRSLLKVVGSMEHRSPEMQGERQESRSRS
jgi:hypothetical protein